MISPIPFTFRLQTRLAATIVTLLAVLMVVITVLGIRRETGSIIKQMRIDGVALAKAYAHSVETAMLLQGAGLSRITGDASRTKGIKYLTVVDTRQRVIGHSDPGRIGGVVRDTLYGQALKTPISAVEKGRTPVTQIGTDTDGKPIYRVVVPLVTVDTIQGLIEVGLDMAGISEAIREANRQSLLIALAAVVCGALLAWLFARTLTRPIRNLVMAVNRVASGDLAVAIPIPGHDEIGGLARSFNNMTGKIREFTGNLREINTRLEADVVTIGNLRSFNENILNSLTPGVLTINREGRITTINQSGLGISNRAREDIVGRHHSDIFAPGDPIRNVLDEMLVSSREIRHHEIQRTAPDGKDLRLRLSTTVLCDGAGVCIGYSLFFDDMSEVRLLERRMQQAERLALMGELAVGIAHEVRNPLGAIKTCAQYLEAKYTDTDPLHRFTRLIIRETDRLDVLVSRLLNYAKPGERDVQYADINELVDDAVMLATLKLGRRAVRMERTTGTGIPLIPADSKRLSQAFLNLLLNAIDAVDDNGTVRVATSYAVDERAVRIQFSDTGEGIPADVLDKIFYPFFTTRKSGTGLGLAIVQQVIDEHNGAVDVQSNQGEGTTFTILLPLTLEHDKHDERTNTDLR